MVQLSQEATARIESKRAEAEIEYWEERAKLDAGKLAFPAWRQQVEELAAGFIPVVLFAHISECFLSHAGPAEIRISAESTLNSLVDELVPSAKWPLPPQGPHRPDFVEAKKAAVLSGIMQGAEWLRFQAMLREQSPAAMPLHAATVPGGQKRGPRSDDEGHRRVAELLPDNWESDLPSTLQNLSKPADGGPCVSVSGAWKTKYSVSSYAEVLESIGDKEIRQHLARRLKRGNALKKLSETVGNSRQPSTTLDRNHQRSSRPTT